MVGCWGHWHSEFTNTARIGVSVSSSSSSTSSSSSSSASFPPSQLSALFLLQFRLLPLSVPASPSAELPDGLWTITSENVFRFLCRARFFFTNALSRQGLANHCRTKPRHQQVLTTHVSANAPLSAPGRPDLVPSPAQKRELVQTSARFASGCIHVVSVREKREGERGRGRGREAHFAVRGPRTTGSRQSRRGWKDPQALGGSLAARKSMQSDPPALPPDVREPAPAKVVEHAKAARPTKATQGYVQGFSRVLADRAPRSRFRFSGAATQDI